MKKIITRKEKFNEKTRKNDPTFQYEYIDLVSGPEVKESKYTKFSDLPNERRIVELKKTSWNTNNHESSLIDIDISTIDSISNVKNIIYYYPWPNSYLSEDRLKIVKKEVTYESILKLKMFIVDAEIFMRNTIETQTESVKELLAAFGLESEYDQTQDPVDVSTQTGIDANIKIDVAGDYCHYFDV